MTTFAALMPMHTYRHQFTAGHIARLEALAGSGNVIHVESLADLTSHPQAGDVSVILTGWGAPKVTPALLAHCPSLQLVAHCAGTLRGVLDPAVFDHGIRSTNSAAANAVPVAEFLVSWVLRWNKQLPLWETGYTGPEIFQEKKSERHAAIGNRDKTIGIIAASKVGRCFADLLRSFDLSVLIYDPFLTESEIAALGARKTDLPTLLRESDIVSINAPNLPETRHMIAGPELAQMRDGALLINTARGALLDHDALLRELRSNRLSAVLDVTDPEPLPAGSPFFSLPNCILTPHVAGSMGREIYRMTESAIREVELFLSGGDLLHEVSARNWSTAA